MKVMITQCQWTIGLNDMYWVVRLLTSEGSLDLSNRYDRKCNCLKAAKKLLAELKNIDNEIGEDVI